MSKLTLPKLTEEQKRAKWTSYEVGGPSGKSPGAEGLGNEFYKYFNSKLIGPFLEMLNESSIKAPYPDHLQKPILVSYLKREKQLMNVSGSDKIERTQMQNGRSNVRFYLLFCNSSDRMINQ